MGVEYSKRPLFAGGWVDKVHKTLTQASTGTVLPAYGTSIIESGSTSGSNIFRLRHPRKKGVVKNIIAKAGSTDAIDVITEAAAASSAAGFIYGTTAQAVRTTTGAASRAITLISVSTSQWAILNRTTGWTLVGTTV